MPTVKITTRLLALVAVLFMSTYAPTANAAQNHAHQVAAESQNSVAAVHADKDESACCESCECCEEGCNCFEGGNCTCENCTCCGENGCCQGGCQQGGCSEGCGCCGETNPTETE